MNKQTPTQQILETVRELREARALATKAEWVLFTEHMRHWQNDIISSDKNGEFVLAQLNRNMPDWKADAKFICLAANKIDQLCEVVELCVEALKFYGDEFNYSVDDYHGISGEMRRRCVLYKDCEERNDVYSYAGKQARNALIKAADILAKDKVK